MRSKLYTKSVLILIHIVGIFAVYNCTHHTLNPDSEGESVASCEGCHTNYSHLQEVYTPDTTAAVGGCGGEAPHYEPYDKVIMDPEDLDAYKESSHYSIGCTGCHNGTDNTADKELAHSGDFISHPSLFYEDKCGSCHSEIVENFKTSLHHGTGQKRKVTIRSGLNGSEDFDKLPAHQIEGYNSNCATCHGTCGNCHIVRPPIGGGRLINSHEFIKTPNMVSVCVTCHTSRGGHAYLGVAAGTEPDVHLTNMDYRCIDCHSADELHGDGQPVEQRYAYSKLPTCGLCHIGIDSKNSYHAIHYNTFNCQVCHSQVYNNCGSCHVHGEGARVPSYLDFKIGANPISDIKDQYEFVLIRRTLAAPDNWKEYGVEEYAAFDELPTYNYTSPHNILRWTDRTQVEDGSSCYSNCHIRKEGDSLVNKNLYLFKDNLLEWEIDATEYVTVDGKLPESWTN